MRLVIRSREEMSEGEPCVDTYPGRVPLEGLRGVYERRGGNYSGNTFYIGPFDNFAIVDLDDEWHRARQGETEDLPDDPLELAALICAIAASTPRYTECYTSDLPESLGTDVHSVAYERAFRSWEVASEKRESLGEGQVNDPEVGAEAHAALECQIIRERAAELCSAMCDQHVITGEAWYTVCEAFGFRQTDPAPRLAWAAVVAQQPESLRPLFNGWAEAEAMIRCGWEPES